MKQTEITLKIPELALQRFRKEAETLDISTEDCIKFSLYKMVIGLDSADTHELNMSDFDWDSETMGEVIEKEERSPGR